MKSTEQLLADALHQRDALLRALERFMAINWPVERGNMYISRRGANEHNAAYEQCEHAVEFCRINCPEIAPKFGKGE